MRRRRDHFAAIAGASPPPQAQFSDNELAAAWEEQATFTGSTARKLGNILQEHGQTIRQMRKPWERAEWWLAFLKGEEVLAASAAKKPPGDDEGSDGGSSGGGDGAANGSSPSRSNGGTVLGRVQFRKALKALLGVSAFSSKDADKFFRCLDEDGHGAVSVEDVLQCRD